MRYTREYNIWDKMIQRCHNHKHTSYDSYGGRGIFVCDEWKSSFSNFYKDVGDCPDPSFTLDRIDNNKGYNKNNYRWTDRVTQSRNTRMSSRNNSGTRGVSYNKRDDKWKAYISVDKKSMYLGYFNKKEDAIKARLVAEIKYWRD